MADKMIPGSVRLSCGGASAVVLLRGAELVSFVDETGHECIWQGDPEVWHQHAPVLFPICGHALDDAIIVDGKSYPMAAHGFAWKSDFSVCRQGEHFVDLVLEANDETRSVYPFDFALHVIYEISGRSFTTTFTVENRTDRMMPFCIGGHPGLNVAFDDEPSSDRRCCLDFETPVSPELDIVIDGGYVQGKECLADLTGGTHLPLTHDMIARRDTLLFSGIASRIVTLTDCRNDVAYRMHFGSFPNLAVWTSGAKYADYVCLEPWYGLPASPGESGVLGEKPGAVLLAPGDTFTDAFTVVRL